MTDVRRILHLTQRTIGDARAIARGRTGQRLFNRIVGRLSNRVLGRIWR